MSFILDALKKSESDRQRQSGPSLFEVKVAPPRRTLPVWAMAIAVLLAINVVVISWMLLRHTPAQQPVAANTAAAAPAPAAVPRTVGAAAASETTPPPPPLAENAASASPGVAARVSPPAPGTGQIPAAAPPPGSAHGGAVQAPRNTDVSDYTPAAEPSPGQGSGASAGDALPLYQQIVASDGLPPLHLDLHVYAKKPKDRFVMINMHKLGEGSTLPDGVQVESIRPDGVVLSYHGMQFLLPRG